MLDGKTPMRGHKATAEELIALHANEAAHPSALGYELKRTTMAVIVELAYSGTIADQLARAAYDEMERRQTAVHNLRTAMGAWPPVTCAS